MPRGAPRGTLETVFAGPWPGGLFSFLSIFAVSDHFFPSRRDASEPPPADEDAALMMRAKDGDLAAFEMLVRKHQKPLMNFFVRLGVTMDVEDLAQETFVRLYRYRARYQPSAKFTTYLYLLARQVRIDFLRKMNRRDALHEKAAKEAPQQAEPAAATRGARLDAATALAQLTDGMREVVVLSVLQGLPHGEIAEILAIPVGTVKSRLSVALHRLREFMQGDEP